MRARDASFVLASVARAGLLLFGLLACSGSANQGGSVTGGAGGVGAGAIATGGTGVAVGGTGAATVGAAGLGTGGTSSMRGAGGAGGAGGAATGGASGGPGMAGAGMAGMTGAAGTSGAAGMRGTGGMGGGGTGGGAAGIAGMVNCSGSPLSGGMQHCSSNSQGTAGNFSWSIWSSGSGGCITPYGVGAAFNATWNNAGDFLAREGFQWDETKTYDQYGTLSADYAYTKTGSAGGYSYIGIYGWSNNPLIEYYIVDDWFGTGGPPTAGGALKGSFVVDGATYDIYTHTQTNQPSIHGTQTFTQFFSIRQTPRQCGHISLTEHFKKWDSLGMTLGKMYEAKILVEAGRGNGSIDFTSASMTSQ